MSSLCLSESLRELRIGSGFLLCGILALALVVAGRSGVAGGVMVGFALFAGNVLLLLEAGRALLGGARRGVRAAVVASTLGRFLLVGLVLAAVFVFLGRPAGLGACGGLFLAQVNLHLPIRRGVAV